MSSSRSRKVIEVVARLVCHTLGMSATFFLGFWVHGTPEVARALGESWHYGFLQNNQFELLLQLGLSGCLWAMIVITATSLQNARRDREQNVTRLKKAKGAVMTETLIVFPVLLLLTVGLLQLTLNNTAAIFTSLAAFQAGRTVYVWDPETDDAYGRNDGQSKSEVEERARIAAASVIAPVAPSNYSGGTCSTSARFDKKLEAMMSVTLGAAGSFGTASAGAVKAVAAGKPILWSRNQTVDRGFDTDKFEIRGPVKMLLAYCQTTVTYERDGGYNKTSVQYDHRISMPMIGYLFGERRGLGYFARIERSYVLPQQLHPNPAVPTSIFGLLAFNPFSSWK